MASACTEGLDTGFATLGYAKVGVLGIVQGITELLPISSTAHMRIIPAFLGWQDPGSAFSAAMQVAALAAVVSYFWADVRGFAVGSLDAIRRRDFQDWNFRFVDLDHSRDHPDRHRWRIAETHPQRVSFAAANSDRDRHRLHCHVRTFCPRRVLFKTEAHPRKHDAERRDDHRACANRCLDPRRIAIWLDTYGGALPGSYPRGSRALFLSAWVACDCRCGIERIMGAAQGSSRRAWLVGPWVWSSHRILVGIRRDLGSAADSRAIFNLALCPLPGPDGNFLARLRILRMAAELMSIVRREHRFRAHQRVEFRGADEPAAECLLP